MKNPLSLYVLCFVCGVIGQLLHLFVVKLPAEKRRAKKANIKFSLVEYFKEDWIAIGANTVAMLGLVILLDEIIGFNPSFVRGIKFGYIGFGYSGSSALIALLGKYGIKNEDIVDKKTDIADGVKKEGL